MERSDYLVVATSLTSVTPVERRLVVRRLIDGTYYADPQFDRDAFLERAGLAWCDSCPMRLAVVSGGMHKTTTHDHADDDEKGPKVPHFHYGSG